MKRCVHCLRGMHLVGNTWWCHCGAWVRTSIGFDDTMDIMPELPDDEYPEA